MLEWREIILGNKIEKEVPKKKTTVKRNKTAVEDTDDDDFVDNSLAVSKRKEIAEGFKEINDPKKKSNIITGLSKILKQCEEREEGEMF